MASEKDLNSTDTESATAADATAAMEQAAKANPRWLRWLMRLFVLIMVPLLGASLYDKFVNFNVLPACDSSRTRETLSDFNRVNKVNASAYNFIKQVSTSETEVHCTANLALNAGGTLEYDFRLLKEGYAESLEVMDTKGATGSTARVRPLAY